MLIQLYLYSLQLMSPMAINNIELVYAERDPTDPGSRWEAICLDWLILGCN